MVTISHLTVRVANLFRRRKGLESPTLQENERSDLGDDGESANLIGEGLLPLNHPDIQIRRKEVIRILQEKTPTGGVAINSEALIGLNLPDQKGILASLLIK